MHIHVLILNVHFLFQVPISSGMQRSKNQETGETAPRHITITREGLQLAVSFPANTTIRLEGGQPDCLPQKEYCECKARTTSREAIKLQ
jgi:hypothetical protein